MVEENSNKPRQGDKGRSHDEGKKEERKKVQRKCERYKGLLKSCRTHE